jgi:hypothetical protein
MFIINIFFFEVNLNIFLIYISSLLLLLLLLILLFNSDNIRLIVPSLFGFRVLVKLIIRGFIWLKIIFEIIFIIVIRSVFFIFGLIHGNCEDYSAVFTCPTFRSSLNQLVVLYYLPHTRVYHS